MPAPHTRLIVPALVTVTVLGTAACASGRASAAADAALRDAAATTSCRATEPAPGVIPPTALRVGDIQARAEICAMMDRGAAAWNRGDLEAFMDDYTDSATYVGSRGLLHGRAAIAAHYAPRFAHGAVRDSLSFRALEVRLVAPELAQVVATYVLSRRDSVTASGPTSLLMRRTADRWRIIHDHSS